jgi:phenylpyruvate tautomerase PptA (4-oxalocrotonate tautomerase family)
MIQPGLALQQAMRAALIARPALTSILGGAHIYDELPRGVNAPYVVFGAIETRDWSVADQKAHEHFVTIEIVSNSRSRAQVQNIIQEIEQALDITTLTLTNHVLINLRSTSSSASKTKGRDNFSATMRFRAATEPL